MNTELLFDRLWLHYTSQNPSAKRIKALFVAEGEEVLNDHVAFRTYNDPRIGIERIARFFKAFGYQSAGEYTFPDKHLFARHYEHYSDPSAPKVFISELMLEKFSPFLQETAKKCIDNIPGEILQSEEMLFCGTPWGLPSWDVYNKLRDESEYAAWFYVYGFRVNHFTISVDSFKKFKKLEEVNAFLKTNGFRLNSSGGEIKGSPNELLEQSSTMADIVPVHFQEGVFEIPACYYEFAKRYPDASGKMYSGFIAKSADKIFESTDFYKK